MLTLTTGELRFRLNTVEVDLMVVGGLEQPMDEGPHSCDFDRNPILGWGYFFGRI